MSCEIEIVTNTDTYIIASGVVNVELRNTTPIGGFTLSENYFFFYNTNPPTDWGHISAAIKESELKSFSKQC